MGQPTESQLKISSRSYSPLVCDLLYAGVVRMERHLQALQGSVTHPVEHESLLAFVVHGRHLIRIWPTPNFLRVALPQPPAEREVSINRLRPRTPPLSLDRRSVCRQASTCGLPGKATRTGLTSQHSASSQSHASARNKRRAERKKLLPGSTTGLTCKGCNSARTGGAFSATV